MSWTLISFSWIYSRFVMDDLHRLQLRLQNPIVEEQEHKTRKAKAEADLAELSLAYGRTTLAKHRDSALS